jgi:tetratricopeptide (TPR) repeat protein
VSRLVVLCTSGLEAPAAELVHPALAQQWPRLREWIEADREFLRWRELLNAYRADWEKCKRDPGGLLSGAHRNRRDLARHRGADLNAQELEFIGLGRTRLQSARTRGASPAVAGGRLCSGGGVQLVGAKTVCGQRTAGGTAGAQRARRRSARRGRTHSPPSGNTDGHRALHEGDHRFSRARTRYVARGQAYAASASPDYERALADFTEAIKLRPGRTENYLLRGAALSTTGNWAGAEADFDEAIALDDQDPAAYYSRAVAHDAQGENEAALADYAKAIARRKDYVEAYLKRGSLLQRMGRSDAASADYRTVAGLATASRNTRTLAERRLAQLGYKTAPADMRATRVFLHYVERPDAQLVARVEETLSRGAGLAVQGSEEVPGRRTSGDVRYFFPQDEKAAIEVRDRVERAVAQEGYKPAAAIAARRDASRRNSLATSSVDSTAGDHEPAAGGHSESAERPHGSASPRRPTLPEEPTCRNRSLCPRRAHSPWRTTSGRAGCGALVDQVSYGGVETTEETLGNRVRPRRVPPRSQGPRERRDAERFDADKAAARAVAPPQPTRRLLRGYAFDPQLSTELESAAINEIVYEVPWEPKLEPGPRGDYLEVIDYDPASGSFYPPVDLDDRALLAQNGLAPSEANPQFHQQMVYAVAMRTIEHFEHALGRRVLWSPHVQGAGAPGYVGQLRVYPHALRQQNAFYDPQRKARLRYSGRGHGSTHLSRCTVFTCLSQDIVAHETTHAILDGVHPSLLYPSNPDTLAFHEAFADLAALFQHFSLPGVLRHQIARARGDLRTRNLLAELAVQFGQATGRYGALRSAIGRVDPATRAWTRLELDRRR